MITPPSVHSEDGYVTDTEQEQQQMEQIVTHPLAYAWDFWVWVGDQSKPWTECLAKQCTMKTIEDFIALKHCILAPSKVPNYIDYYYFKRGVEPDYENDANNKGGMFYASVQIQSRHSKLDVLWQALLVAVLGGQFYEASGNICGLVMSNRPAWSKIAIWIRDANSREMNEIIRDIMAEHLGIENPRHLIFKRHSAIPANFII